MRPLHTHNTHMHIQKCMYERERGDKEMKEDIYILGKYIYIL